MKLIAAPKPMRPALLGGILLAALAACAD